MASRLQGVFGLGIIAVALDVRNRWGRRALQKMKPVELAPGAVFANHNYYIPTTHEVEHEKPDETALETG